MKKIFTSLFVAALFATSVNAQSHISFEESEGYSLGDLPQEGLSWVATPTNEAGTEFIFGQAINNDFATDGVNSLLVQNDDRFGTQQSPFVGVSFLPSEPFFLYDETATTSFDIMVPAIVTDAVYGLQFLNENSEGIFYVTYIQLIEDTFALLSESPDGFTLLDSEYSVEAGTWYEVKFVSSPIQTEVFINDESIGFIDSFSADAINRVAFTTNNAPNAKMYVDNISFPDDLAVNDFSSTEKTIVYPNPVKDVLNVKVSSNNTLNNVEVTNVAGKSFKVSLVDGTVNLSSLPSGVYMITLDTENGKESHKVIKK